MSAEGATKSNILIIVLGVTVLLLILAVVVLATPLKERIFAPRSAPTIELAIVEGELDEGSGLYGYLVEAVVTGRPTPEVLFNRNDGIGEVESNHTLILLAEGESFVLQATATNALGSASASLELTSGEDTTNGVDVTQGTIEGHIVYPSAGVPPDLQIVAKNLSTGLEYFASGVITDSKYTSGFGFIIQVPPGDYHLYAFNPGDDYRAYYDEYVQSNFTVDSHEKIVVTITARLHLDDAIVGNWWIVPEETANRPPVISGIDFSTSPLYAGEPFSVTVQASDPDGDALSYQWWVDGVIVRGAAGNTTDWPSPIAGRYELRVVVSDGRGGEAERSETVVVNPVSSFVPVRRETGHIAKEVRAYPGYYVYAGDSATNIIARGFISFDVSQLAGARVHKVELRLADPHVTGNPSFMHIMSGFAQEKFRGLWVEVVVWGARDLQLSDYDLPGSWISSHTNYDITLTSNIGGRSPALAESLQTYLDGGYNRFKLRLRFYNETSNNNNLPDGVSYNQDKITLKVWYEEP